MDDVFSSFRKRSLALMTFAAAASGGCKAGSCDDDLVDHAVTFMKAHQSCEVDADCVTVSDYCETLPGGACGSLIMNRTGRDSTEWAGLKWELESCAPDECSVNSCAVIPSCKEGSCTPY